MNLIDVEDVKRLRVAVVHPRGVEEITVASGIPWFVRQTVQKHIGDTVPLPPYPGSSITRRGIARIRRSITGKRSPLCANRGYAKQLGAWYSERLKGLDVDLIVAPRCSEIVAFLETEVPIVHYADITWKLIVGYYKHFSNLTKGIVEQGEELEMRSEKNAWLTIFTSKWAADSAREDYGTDPDKVHVLYMGANLLSPPPRSNVLRSVDGPIRLLFVGVNWYGKGADVAIQILDLVRERGIEASLTVVGCEPPATFSHPHVEVIPFLNKQVPAERAQFEDLWMKATFFLLPTNFEAAGIVFCEAAAYGLPSLASRTGGVPSIVRDGVNGYTVPESEGVDGFAKRIEDLVNEPETYATVSNSARQEFETRLNWDSFGISLREIIADKRPEWAERLAVPDSITDLSSQAEQSQPV